MRSRRHGSRLSNGRMTNDDPAVPGPPMFRLLIDPPASGVWNMAVDEALLSSAAGKDGIATLRFYAWSQPTLSLGYFQRVTERFGHEPSAASVLVRRSTGGGAILHHHDLTYSLTTPLRSRFSDNHQQLYVVIHQSLVDALAKWHVNVRVHDQSVKEGTADKSFLCFQRLTEGDVICHGTKIAGSAQRRRRGSLLQHGSVLLAGSSFAPELPGISNLTGTNLPVKDLVKAWIMAISQRLGSSPQSGSLRAEEIGWAKSFAADKFGHDKWTNRR